ncbi:MAG: AEC family transporter [SAR324 cluster bacterium]|nr:AEC family transporter [SAR324 cluster bacterium]
MRSLLLLAVFLASFIAGSGLTGWFVQDTPGLPPLIRVFLDIITPVFLLVGIGYFAAPRLGVESRSLTKIAYYVFVPAFIFNTISSATIPGSLFLLIFGFTVVLQLSVTTVAGLTGFVLRRPKETIAAFIMVAVFPNVGNFGLGIIEFHLGQEALLLATVYFLCVSMTSFTISVTAASLVRHGGLSTVLKVFRTPALLALWPALAFYILGMEVPLVLERMTGLLGQAMVPVMLVTLGVQLSEIEKIEITWEVWVATGIRLLVVPALTALLAHLFGLEGFARSAGILQFAMPAAVLVAIVAMEHNLQPAFATTTVLVSTLVSLLTLTVLLTLV